MAISKGFPIINRDFIHIFFSFLFEDDKPFDAIKIGIFLTSFIWNSLQTHFKEAFQSIQLGRIESIEFNSFSRIQSQVRYDWKLESIHINKIEVDWCFSYVPKNLPKWNQYFFLHFQWFPLRFTEFSFHVCLRSKKLVEFRYQQII